ncbi:MAG: CusA/CzcA family heavy metal efflux RND transporter [Myxococcaceae bacterium]
MMRRLVEGSIDRARMVVAITLALAALAAVIASGLEFDALPDLTNNQVLVLANAPGLTPEELERQVTRPLELALGGAPGLVEQRSLSRYGIAALTAVFDDDVPVYLARQLVSERLDSVALPPGVRSVELGPVTGGLGEVFHFTLRSDARSLPELQELLELRVAPLLKTVPGVVEVNAWGGARRTLDVVADPLRLAQRELTLQELATALEKTTGTAPGAALSAGDGQQLLRAQALPLDEAALGNGVVQRRAGDGTVRLTRVNDVADVQFGEQVRLGAASRNGAGEVLYVMVQMLRGTNALALTDRLHARMGAVEAALPPDVKLDLVYDRSVLVTGTLKTVARSLAEGGLLVMAVLFLLLGSVRAGVLVATVIPLSMVFAAAAMRVLGLPGNLMSLGALDFGLLVDGAVVMVEGALALLAVRRHDASRQVVREATGNLAQPVFFSVLIILLVYVPVLSLGGTDGKLFRPMAMTVVMALAAALVLSLTFVPAATALFVRTSDAPQKEPWLMRLVHRAWHPVVTFFSVRPALVTALALLGLVVGGVLARAAGTEFTPQLNEGDLIIQTNRRPDVSLPQSVDHAAALERTVLAAAPEVKQVVSRVGSPAVATDIMGLEQADVFVTLRPRDEWRPGLTLQQLVAELDAALHASGEEAELSFTQPIQMRFNELLGGSVTDVSVSLYGEDQRALDEAAAAVKELLLREPGAADVRILAPPNVPMLTVKPRPTDAATAGLDSADVLLTVQAARQGREVGLTWRGPTRVPIMLRQRHAEPATLFGSTAVPTPNGGVVSLERVAELDSSEAPGLVNRRNGSRRVMVGFNVRGADLGTVVEHAQASLAAAPPLPRGVNVEWGGQYESLQQARARLALVIPAVLALIFLVLFSAFRALSPVLVVFSHVPFAAVGGLVALALRGLPISLSAVIGFIALAGIAVLNGVVLLTSIVELERQGVEPAKAALEAAEERVRPVLMTALVAMLGFVPMMLASGPGAEVQRPLATVVVGGLFSSTALTLVVLPTLYRFFKRRPATPPAAAEEGA